MPKPSTPEANAAMAQSRGGRVATPESLRRGRAKPNIDFLIGKRVAHAATSPAYERRSSDPVYRPLRIYALDPSASTADGAHSVVNVPYEPLELPAVTLPERQKPGGYRDPGVVVDWIPTPY